MKCNRLLLIVGSILILFITLLICVAVMASYYFMILLAFWLLMVYLKTAFIYQADKENIILVRRFKIHKIKSADVVRVYAKRSVEGYRGLLFEFKISGKTLHVGFPFAFEDYATDVLNFINGHYNIDAKSFETIGILYDQNKFKYLPGTRKNKH